MCAGRPTASRNDRIHKAERAKGKRQHLSLLGDNTRLPFRDVQFRTIARCARGERKFSAQIFRGDSATLLTKSFDPGCTRAPTNMRSENQRFLSSRLTRKILNKLLARDMLQELGNSVHTARCQKNSMHRNLGQSLKGSTSKGSAGSIKLISLGSKTNGEHF